MCISPCTARISLSQACVVVYFVLLVLVLISFISVVCCSAFSMYSLPSSHACVVVYFRHYCTHLLHLSEACVSVYFSMSLYSSPSISCVCCSVFLPWYCTHLLHLRLCCSAFLSMTVLIPSSPSVCCRGNYLHVLHASPSSQAVFVGAFLPCTHLLSSQGRVL